MNNIYELPRRTDTPYIKRDMKKERETLLYNASRLMAEYVVNFESGGAGPDSENIYADRVECYLTEVVGEWMDQPINADDFPARRCEYFAGLSTFVDSINRMSCTDHGDTVAEEAKTMLTIIKMWREWELI